VIQVEKYTRRRAFPFTIGDFGHAIGGDVDGLGHAPNEHAVVVGDDGQVRPDDRLLRHATGVRDRSIGPRYRFEQRPGRSAHGADRRQGRAGRETRNARGGEFADDRDRAERANNTSAVGSGRRGPVGREAGQTQKRAGSAVANGGYFVLFRIHSPELLRRV